MDFKEVNALYPSSKKVEECMQAIFTTTEPSSTQEEKDAVEGYTQLIEKIDDIGSLYL